ncbi:MAG: hypothetical protein K6B46_03200 [Opitutales bacterium]|nr:hypothetical protein [Opitutales bacterium]
MRSDKSLTSFKSLLKTAEGRFCRLREAPFVASQILITRDVEGFPFREDNKIPRQNMGEDLKKILESCDPLKNWIFVDHEKLSPNDYVRLADLHLFDDKGSPDVVIEPRRNPDTAIYVNARDNFQFVICGNDNAEKDWLARYEKLSGLVSEIEETVNFAQTADLGYLTSSPEMVGNAVSLQALLHLPALLIEERMGQVVDACNAVGVRVRGYRLKDSDSTGAYFTLETSRMLGTTPKELIRKFSELCGELVRQEERSREKLADDERLFFKIQDCYAQARFCSMFSYGQAMNVVALLLLGVGLGYFPEDLKTELDLLPPNLCDSAFPSAAPDQRLEQRATLIRETLEGLPPPRKKRKS